jgi:5-methylcytosine-specific restriction protein A
MPMSPGTFGGKPVTARHNDRARGSASSRGYDRAWEKIRDRHRASEPLCRMCLAQGLTVAMAEVDHIVKVRDRPDLRLVDANLQSLCKPCHSAKTASGG